MSDYPGYQPVPPPVSSSQTSTLAIVSLVSGIASWLLLPVVGAIIAVITGHMARNEIKNSMGRLSGDGLAIGGLVLGYLHFAMICLVVCVLIGLLVFGVSIGTIFSNSVPVP